MRKSTALSAVAAGMFALGSVAQSASAACDIDGIAPYTLSPGGAQKLEIWGNGMNTWPAWKKPTVQICGWNNKVWNYTNLQVYIDPSDGDWYMLAWLIDEESGTGPQVPWWHNWPATTACSIQVKQKKKNSYQNNECSFGPVPTALMQGSGESVSGDAADAGLNAWLAGHPNAQKAAE